MRHTVYVTKSDNHYDLWIPGVGASSCNTLADVNGHAREAIEFVTGKNTDGDHITLQFKTPIGRK